MKISSVNLEISAVRISQYPTVVKPEFLLVGRSNVGKSSFVNSLINRKNFARTSSKPGKTQTLNFYNINEAFYFVDVPGYGYAAVSKSIHEKFGKMIEEYLENRQQLKMVFMLVDFRHKPTEDDVLMYNFLKHYNVPTTIIATKIDKIGKTHYDKQTKLIKKTLAMDENDYFVPFSAITKVGKKEVHAIIERIID